MTIKFIHTADWQIGKPFAGVADTGNRAKLRDQRVEAIKHIGELAREHLTDFVLVAGDLFDTTTPDNKTVAAACSAIGSIGVPVIAIPGNHDHASPGSIWEQDFFLREKAKLAPNFTLLSAREPFTAHGAVILPCPLVRRQDTGDVTAWLHDGAWKNTVDSGHPRIVLAHGSVQGFTSVADGEESSGQPNLIELNRLAAQDVDYVALGDWHGTKNVTGADGKAWYSGTPELDRFQKGGDHNPGNVLLVKLPGRGHPPVVTILPTARIGWHEEDVHLTGDADIDRLEAKLTAILGTRAREDLLQLRLTGNIGLQGEHKLAAILEGISARLLRIKLDNQIVVLPSEEEIHQLSGRAGDPLIATMATRLVEMAGTDGENRIRASLALRELYALVGTAKPGNA